jgi:hypothetical protein
MRIFSSEYFRTITTMLTNAFGLVAALAWNEVIKNGISRYVPTNSNLFSELIYALLVTIILVIMTIQLGKIAEHFKEEENVSKNSLH